MPVRQSQLGQFAGQSTDDLVIRHAGQDQLRRFVIEVNSLAAGALRTMTIAAGVIVCRDLVTIIALELATAQDMRAAKRQLCQHALNLIARGVVNRRSGSDSQDLRDG